jgi:hypothetical protein
VKTSEHIVIDARNVDISEEMARKGTYRAMGMSDNFESIEIIGKDYHFITYPKK